MGGFSFPDLALQVSVLHRVQLHHHAVHEAIIHLHPFLEKVIMEKVMMKEGVVEEQIVEPGIVQEWIAQSHTRLEVVEDTVHEGRITVLAAIDGGVRGIEGHQVTVLIVLLVHAHVHVRSADPLGKRVRAQRCMLVGGLPIAGGKVEHDRYPSEHAHECALGFHWSIGVFNVLGGSGCHPLHSGRHPTSGHLRSTTPRLLARSLDADHARLGLGLLAFWNCELQYAIHVLCLDGFGIRALRQHEAALERRATELAPGPSEFFVLIFHSVLSAYGKGIVHHLQLQVFLVESRGLHLQFERFIVLGDVHAWRVVLPSVASQKTTNVLAKDLTGQTIHR